MKLADDYKDAFELSMHFNAKGKALELSDAIKFYYKIAVLPLIIAIALFALLSLSHVLNKYQSLEGITVIALYIALPAVLIFTAAVYQLFAKKLFHIWKNNYKNTLSAVFYGMIPFILFGWTFILPVVSVIFMILIGIWDFVLLVIAMAKMQNITLAKSFLGIFISQIILSIIVGALMFGLKLTGFESGLIQNPSTRTIVINMTNGPAISNIQVNCIPQPGYECQHALFNQGMIYANVSQKISSDWPVAQFVMVSRGQSPAGAVLSAPVYGGMPSGAIEGVIIPSAARLYKGVPFNGTIYVIFQNSSQSSSQSEAIFAYVSFTPNSDYIPPSNATTGASSGSSQIPQHNTDTTTTTSFTTTSTVLPTTSNENFSCGNFDVATNEYGYTEKGICNWTGGNLWLKAGAGGSGYIAYKITGLSDGKVYISNSTTSWCGVGYGPVYLPAQKYVVQISTGHGGGSCISNKNLTYIMLYQNKTSG
ncbi:MAG: Yip1 family protein [Candidatus Micrarchaeia archaeon]